MVVWTKLVGAQELEDWEERFVGEANLVVEYVKGGRSVRLRLFCEDERAAEGLKGRFGGSFRRVEAAEWSKPVAAPRPLKVRDVFLLTAETGKKELAALGKANPGRQLIFIPPEMAFGTGDHATTSTCLRLLVDIGRERKGTEWSVADLGTGTGVLAIAAHKLGCGPIYACDFDPFAVKVAEENFQRNGTPGIEIREQDVLKWKPRKVGYDVVMANLFSTVLIEAWPVIAKSLGRGGDLLVSGILASQAWDVFKAAAGCGLGFTKVVRRGKWVTARGGHFDDLID